MVDFLEDMQQDEINQSYDVIDDKFVLRQVSLSVDG
jgi:hypothetical protein